jgi:UDP-N-acetylmuramoyl-tripeptide--D-alanyl-D-alanine ligase
MIYAQDIHYAANGCARFTLVFPKGRVDIELHVPGAHNVSNAIAAASCTYAVGISLEQIQAGLQSFRGVSGRLTFLQAKNHAVVIDDSYNANLRSSLAALDVLAKRPGRRIFVFGDMGELGPWSQAHHHDVGRAAQASGIEVLMTYGKHSALASEAFGENAKHYHDRQALVADLLSQMNEQTTVLIKGSRSSRMEEIIQQLL